MKVGGIQLNVFYEIIKLMTKMNFFNFFLTFLREKTL